MDLFETLCGLDLDYYGVLNEEIEPVSDIQGNLAIDHRDGLLALHPQPPISQLEYKTSLVGRLEQTWPKSLVYVNGRAYSSVSKPIQSPLLFHYSYLCGLRALCGCNWLRAAVPKGVMP